MALVKYKPQVKKSTKKKIKKGILLENFSRFKIVINKTKKKFSNNNIYIYIHSCINKFRKSYWKNINPKIQSFIMLFLIFVPTFILIASFATEPVEAAWYDAGYSFRKKLPISNTSGSMQTDFQMQITVDTASLITAGKMQSDCDDMRFTDIKGKVLGYWLEPNTCNTANTIVWFKVPKIAPAPSGTTTDVFFYYGNPTATSASSTTNTFIRDMNGAVVNYPLDDTTATQSYSRVVNPAVATGRNIVLNAGFDTWSGDNPSSWTTTETGDATSNITENPSGQVQVIRTTNAANITQNNILTAGKTYKVTVDIKTVVSGALLVRDTLGGGAFVWNTVGVNTGYFIALNTNFQIAANSNPTNITFDNVTVQQVNIPSSTSTPTQLWADGDMETIGIANWSGTGTISKQTGSPYAGSQVLRVTSGGTNIYASQLIGVLGTTYRAVGYARSDGTVAPVVSNSGGVALWTGTTSTSWQPFDVIVVAPGVEPIKLRTTATGYTEWDNVIFSVDNAIRPGELLQDNNMEKVSTVDWTALNSSTITKETTSPHGGSQVLRISRNGVNNPGTRQNILLIGKKYRITGFMRSDGSATPSVVLGGTTFPGSTSTSWQAFDLTALATLDRVDLNVTTSTGTQYAEFDDISVTEINPLVGVPNNGVTLGAASGGHGSTAYSFDGTNDFVNAYSSDFNSVFSPDEGTIVVWAKVTSSGVWSDGVARRVINIQNGGTDYITILKNPTSNELVWQYSSGGVPKTRTKSGVSTTGWMQLAITWSKTSDEVKVYYNGVQDGSTLTGLGTWSGNLHATQGIVIGSFTTSGTSPWSGLINDFRLYNRPLTASEISDQYSASSDIQAYTTTNYPNQELLRKYNSLVVLGSPATEEVGPGPVADWSFDDGQGQVVQDSTRNNNDGVLGANSSVASDDPAWQSEDMCVSGKCLKFDGTNDYVKFANTINFGSSDFSFGTWFKMSGAGGGVDTQNPIFSQRIDTSGNAQPAVNLIVDNNRLLLVQIRDNVGAVVQINPSTALQYNSWYRVDVVKTASLVSVYLNGVLFGSTTHTLSGNFSLGATNRTIGAHQYNGSILRSFFNGYIDELKVFPYTRSVAQIKTEFNLGVSALSQKNDKAYLSDGLVGYWKMDEASWNNNCSTATVMDSSGNNNHGTSCPSGGGLVGGTAGKFGNGAAFDGVNDYINVGSTISNQLTNRVSLSYWINIASNVSGNVVSKRGSPNVLQLTFTSGVPTFSIWQSNNTAVSATAPSSLSLNQWHHVVGITDGSRVNLYIDGVLVNSAAYDGTMATDLTSSLYIGSLNGASGWINAQIDETRIYNKALSAQEVTDLYNWAPGPVAHWRMDDEVSGNAQTIADSSGNGLNGSTVLGANATGMNCTDSGKFGGGCTFDGVDDYIDVGDVDTLDFVGSFSIGAWVKTTLAATPSVYPSIAGKAFLQGSVNGYGLFLNGDASNDITFQVRNNNPGINVSGGSINDGNWHYVVGVRNHTTNTSYIYVDGILKNTDSSTALANYSSTVPFQIGARRSPPSSELYFFSGRIDDVKVYNYARTQSQILDDMGGVPAPTSVGAVLPDPIAYYKLDEQNGQVVNNSGISGSSSNGTLGSGSGAEIIDPTWKSKEECKSNNCTSFDGVDDYLNFGTSTAWVPRDVVSVSAWIKTSASATQTVAMFGDEGGNQRIWSAQINSSGRLIAQTGSIGGTNLIGTSIINNNAWHHVAITKTGFGSSDTFILYVDGKAEATATAPQQAAGHTSKQLTVGISNTLGSTSGEPFTGLIDEVKIFNTALTADQIKLDYNAGTSLNFGSTSVSEASLLNGGAGAAPNLEWKLDEKSGEITKDTSGSNISGQLGSTSGSDVNDPTWTQGKEGAGLSFDGTTDYVTVPDTSALNLTTLTLETWVKFNTVNGTNKTIVAKWQPGVKQQYVLQLDSDNKLAFWTGNGTTGGNRLASTLTPAANTWYHVVATASGANKAIYINGRLDASTAAGFALSGSSDIDFSVGSKKDGSGTYFEFLDGYVDQIRVYNYVRTPGQIAYNYNRGLPIGWWKLDECQGLTANDSSGNGNSGTIVIGATGTQTVQGTCNTSSTAWGNGAVGKFNSGLGFDGTDDYLSRTQGLIANNNFYTISGWFKTTSTSSIGIYAEGAFSSIPILFVRLNRHSTGDFTFEHRGDDGVLQSITAPPNNYINGEWHFFTIIRNGVNSFQLFIDGVQRGTGGVTVGATSVTNSTIGSLFQSNNPLLYFPGQIDDVRIYNYPLSPDQIKQVYNGGAVRFGPASGTP